VRKIVVYELLSLDGVAEDPDSFFAEWDDAMDANLAAVIATQDAVILGRRSYTEWAQFWPSSQIQPFATFINGVTKYVTTSTPLDRDWVNRRCSTAGWSISFGISSSSAEAMSASTQVSRSHRRCSPPTLLTSSGS
jgi:dihydrofolate reductase